MTLVPLTSLAKQQFTALRLHYLARERLEALRNLNRVLIDASARIRSAPMRGMPAPRPYPSLVTPGWFWLKSGPYWIAYSPAPLAITAIFHESSDIPNRLR